MTLPKSAVDQVMGFPLSDEQWVAVSAGLDPAVIVAGAGSGKTTAMAARVAYLVGSEFVRPDEVLGLTFTTKAAAQLLGEMRARVDGLIRSGVLPPAPEDADPAGEPQVLTYHAFSARIVSEHGIRLGMEPAARMLTDGLRHQLAYRVVCRTTLPFAPFGLPPGKLTSALLALDDELVELAIPTDELREFDEALVARLEGYRSEHGSLQAIGETMLAASSQRAVLARLVDEWRDEKASRGVMDFADQIRLAGDIVANYPDVVADLRTRYRTVLLDEYQDTSIAQRILLQHAFGDGQSVMAVGDPFQAIYGWRGASVDNIDSFTRHFPPADAGRKAMRIGLTQNRRSGPVILEAANRTAERLRQAHPGVEPLRPGDTTTSSGVVSCALFDTYSAELDWLVQQVAATPGAPTSDGPAGWRDIAVLCATGADVMAVDAALRGRGIPTQVVGAAALLEQPAVVEARAMLELIHDPTANPAFVRVAAGPRWRIDARDLAALGDRAAGLAGGRGHGATHDLATALDEAVAGADVVDSVSLTEALDDLGDLDRYSAEAVERFAAMARELDLLRRHVGEPLPDLILRVLRVTGLEVEASLGPPGVAASQRHAIAGLLDLAAEFTELDGRFTLGAFLSHLRDAERFDVRLDLEVTGPDDAVRLLTVHKAKGLEFPYVFVPFVSESAFPGGRGRAQWHTSASTVPWPLRQDATDALRAYPGRTEPPRSIHNKAYCDELRELADLEAERLAYVAFTRSKRGLTVSGHWWGPKQKKPRGPSRFLTCVHEVCEEQGTVAFWAEPPADDATNPEPAASAIPMGWPKQPAEDRAAAVRSVAEQVRSVAAHQPVLAGLPAGGEHSDVVEHWDLLVTALVAEERSRTTHERVVRLPGSVSASLLMHALKDPEQVAQDLVRPMPRPPAPAARRGTEFHAWVESRYGQQAMLDPDDLPGAADAGIASDEALAALKSAFERSPYALLSPAAIEAPFAVVVGGRVVNGRIDAVFEDGGRYDVVDWKTGSAGYVDPMQLALYRLAWSRLAGVPLEQVDAAFVMVATGEVLRPDTDAALALLGA
ncbi:MAG: ATP-dependent DNA helicase [Actinomycetota bacterium]|nr:ATP-dependent DNA helicase [Actinomycetota bacterium]